MEITDIIKNAFTYPSKDLGKLAIYIVLSVVAIFVCIGAITFLILGFANIGLTILGFIFLAFSLIIGFILSGYTISIVKSGIDKDEEAPEYIWGENLFTGVKYVILSIVYYVIPTIIVFIVASVSNLFGNINDLFGYISNVVINESTNLTSNVTMTQLTAFPTNITNGLVSSLSITFAVAIIIYLIFAFIQAMGEARLAKTGSLSQGINLLEAVRDIGRIGWGKVIGTILLVGIIMFAINAVINLISTLLPPLSIISIIVYPYLMFFASYAVGLLYSDIP